MLELLSNLSHWLEGFSYSEWVIVVLVAVAFIESIISPFPPDPILIAASVFNPDMALILAASVTVASVAGALCGYWLGNRCGRPIINRFVSANKVERVEELFSKYGVWAIIFGAVTPVPYKVFAITAGAMEMDKKPFIVASFIGRGARMFMWAALAIILGNAALEFLETNGLLVGIAFGVATVAAFVIYLLIARLRRRPAKVARQPQQPD